MDPERQPLLLPAVKEITINKSRSLNYEEVLYYQENPTWRGARLCMVLVFWATMALFLSIIVSMLMHHDCTQELGPVPSVPPVHMSLAPLIHR